MKTKRIQAILVAAALVFLLANVASAGDRFQHRQNNQKHRIHQGVKKGEITKREATHLARHQRNVKKYKHHALRDGNLSRSEGRRLNHLQDRASGAIYRNRYNDDNQHRHDQYNRHRYCGPVYGYRYTPHRNFRSHSGYNFYSIWALPGWAFGFSSHGR
jgi:hypothetical protein